MNEFEKAICWAGGVQDGLKDSTDHEITYYNFALQANDNGYVVLSWLEDLSQIGGAWNTANFCMKECEFFFE